VQIWYEVSEHFDLVQKVFKKCECNETDTTVMFYVVLKPSFILVFMATQTV
jgi:hypothetical protein